MRYSITFQGNTMRRRALVAAFGLTSLVPAGLRAAALVQVVTSFSILADMVRHIGGELVAVRPLVGPDADVHVYDPRPKDLQMLTVAGLLVQNGLGLEGWMVRLVASAAFKG